MKKSILITAIAALTLTLMLCACGKAPKTQEAAAPAETATATPQPTKSPTELIIGTWNIDEVEGIDPAAAESQIVGKFLKKGSVITITDDHKIKFGILTAEYSEDGFDTITVTSSLLPTAIDIKYTVDESALTATVMGKYTAKCTRDK